MFDRFDRGGGVAGKIVNVGKRAISIGAVGTDLDRGLGRLSGFGVVLLPQVDRSENFMGIRKPGIEFDGFERELLRVGEGFRAGLPLEDPASEVRPTRGGVGGRELRIESKRCFE